MSHGVWASPEGRQECLPHQRGFETASRLQSTIKIARRLTRPHPRPLPISASTRGRGRGRSICWSTMLWVRYSHHPIRNRCARRRSGAHKSAAALQESTIFCFGLVRARAPFPALDSCQLLACLSRPRTLTKSCFCALDAFASAPIPENTILFGSTRHNAVHPHPHPCPSNLSVYDGCLVR